MKKIIIIIFITVITVIATNNGKTYAVGDEVKREIKQDIKDEVKEKIASRPAVLRKARAAIIGGTLSSKNGTTLTVTKDGKTYTVLTDIKTQLRRRFWGKATLDEIQVGDSVNVHGRWTDESQTTIQAVLIRDMSIQKRFGVFFGTLTATSSSGWVMETIKREKQTVTVSSDTRLVNRRGETISQSDIAVGHRVRVKGLWNSQNNTITEVTHVKDFSLPPFPTPSK